MNCFFFSVDALITRYHWNVHNRSAENETAVHLFATGPPIFFHFAPQMENMIMMIMATSVSRETVP